MLIDPTDGESQGYAKNISLQKVHYNLSNKDKFLVVIIFFFYSFLTTFSINEICLTIFLR